jgi:threonine dehydratase
MGRPRWGALDGAVPPPPLNCALPPGVERPPSPNWSFACGPEDAYPEMTMITDVEVRAAAERIAGRIRTTPCNVAQGLSELTGAEVVCKHEHLQATGSFKERGACNRLLTLSPDQRQRGVVAASAGNHALGLSYHGRQLGVAVTVVMPRFAPLVKVARCRALGADVVLRGDSYDESKRWAREIATERGLTFIHGFDDPEVIAGQGTVGLEIYEQVPDLDVLLVPVGGGGLLAGIVAALQAHPSLRIVAVEPEHAPTLSRSLEAGRVVAVATEPTLADGLLVAELGHHCLQLIQRGVERVELVSEAAIATAIVRLMESEKTLVEGAGAVGLAALLENRERYAGRKVGLLLSGGNIDLSTVSRIIDRGLAAQGRLCRFTVEIQDHPGTLAALTKVVAATGANVQQIDHDRNFGPADVSRVRVALVLETRDEAHIGEVERALDAAGICWSR